MCTVVDGQLDFDAHQSLTLLHHCALPWAVSVSVTPVQEGPLPEPHEGLFASKSLVLCQGFFN